MNFPDLATAIPRPERNIPRETWANAKFKPLETHTTNIFGI